MRPSGKNKILIVSFILALFCVCMLVFFYLRQPPTAGAKIDIPWLGLDIKTREAVANNTSSARGVAVAQVFKDSPADKAGIVQGDVIVTYKNLAIQSAKGLNDAVRESKVGEVVRVGLLRGSSSKTVYVKLQGRPDNAYELLASTTDPSKLAWGIIVSSPTPELRVTYGIPPAQKGVIVVAVLPDTQAARLGILPGDLITSVNRQTTDSIQDFYDAITQNGINQVVVLRNGQTYSYIFKVDPNNPPLASMGTLVAASVARKVAISATEPDLDSPVAFRFASAPYFILYDTRYNKYTALENPMADQGKAQGGQIAQYLINNGAGAVITGSIGSTAFQYFQSMNIPVYTGSLGIIADVIESYKKGELTPSAEETLLSKRNLLSGQNDGLQQTAGSSTSNRSDLCLCTNCGLILSHAAGASCAQLTCPNCGARLTRADAATTNLNQPAVIPSQTTAGQPTAGGSKVAYTIIGGTTTIYNVDDTDLSGAKAAENETQQPNATNSGPATGEGSGYPPNRPYTVPGQQTVGTTGNTTGILSEPKLPQDLSYSASKDKEKIGKDPVNTVASQITDKLKDKDKDTLNTYAVALMGPTVDSEVADDFSNAPYFLIIPSQGRVEIVPNPNATDLLDNDRQTAQFIIDEGATVVVAETFTDSAVSALEELRAKAVDGITGIAKQLFNATSSTQQTTTETESRMMRPGTTSSSTASTGSSDSEEEGGPPPGKGGGKAKGKGEAEEL
ncbi:MAG: PDZ domain-containing protein [Deltaproteobacteria bacterium]|nr:PDZ domain-containing protein [Deltaproteobacteria bacterium]